MLAHVLAHIRQHAPAGTHIFSGQQTPDLEDLGEREHGTVYYVESSGMMYAYDGKQKEWFEMGAWHDLSAYALLLGPLEKRNLRTPGQRRTIRVL